MNKSIIWTREMNEEVSIFNDKKYSARDVQMIMFFSGIQRPHSPPMPKLLMVFLCHSDVITEFFHPLIFWVWLRCASSVHLLPDEVKDRTLLAQNEHHAAAYFSYAAIKFPPLVMNNAMNLVCSYFQQLVFFPEF